MALPPKKKEEKKPAAGGPPSTSKKPAQQTADKDPGQNADTGKEGPAEQTDTAQGAGGPPGMNDPNNETNVPEQEGAAAPADQENVAENGAPPGEPGGQVNQAAPGSPDQAMSPETAQQQPDENVAEVSLERGLDLSVRTMVRVNQIAEGADQSVLAEDDRTILRNAMVAIQVIYQKVRGATAPAEQGTVAPSMSPAAGSAQQQGAGAPPPAAAAPARQVQ